MALPTASDNVYPKVILVEGSAPASPSATQFKLYVDSSDHLLKYKNSAGTVVILGAGMTNPLTTTGDIIYSSSGTTAARRAIGSTGDVLTVSGGVPTWAAPGGATFYGARAIRTTTQSITNATFTALSYDSETAPGWDVGGVHEGVTNPSRFTVPTGGAGKWEGGAGGNWDTNGSGALGRYMFWRLNGTTDIPGTASQLPPNTGGRHQQAVCPALLLADGDYVEVIVYQDSGGTRTIGSASLDLGSIAASFYRVG